LGGTTTGSTGGGVTTGGSGVGTGTGAGAGVWQAASAKATAASETGKLRRIDNMGVSMWILMVEAGVALFLLVFIVWWTMYSGPKHTRHEQDKTATPSKDDKDEA
jgi:hypothetical protein